MRALGHCARTFGVTGDSRANGDGRTLGVWLSQDPRVCHAGEQPVSVTHGER